MNLEFELDEILYTRVLRFLKKRKRNNPLIKARRVSLEEIKGKLTLIARAVTGTAINIFPAEREGGYKDDNFFLPIECDFFEEKIQNQNFFLFRTLYLCQQKALNFNKRFDEDFDDEEAVISALETSQKVLEKLFEEYPVLEDWHFEFLEQLPAVGKKDLSPDTTWLYGKWMKNSLDENRDDRLQNINDKTKEIQNNIDPETIIKARAVEEIQSLTIDKKQQEDYVLLHNFEKVETAEEFHGNWRDFDGADELEDHQEALEELNMRFTVRVDDPVHSVYQAEFVENTSISESAEIDENGFHLKYDEWDYKKRSYRRDFCKVYPRKQIKTDSDYYRTTIQEYKTTLNGLRKMLTSVNNKMQQQRKQLQGDSFDLDALTDLYVDIHSGKSPDERVYLSQRKKDKDLAILVLMDLSLSSDSYAAGNRVLDVEKQASILFGEILNEFDIHFAIDGFSSKTRNFTTYLTLKDFDEKWNSGKHKIGSAEPVGYTRIGPALRHAGARILQTEARNKWIILLSDGKPNDYDKYEGQHGIRDIKQALKELNTQQVNTYALAIEAQAKYYLPQMFGQNHYQILTNPQELLKSLAKLYEKIKNQ